MKNIHRFAPAAASCALFIFCTACTTVPRDEVYALFAKEDNRGRLDEIERSITVLYIENDGVKNTAVKKELDLLVATPSSDSGYLARLYALYADWYLVNRDKTAAKKMLKTAQNYNGTDEYVLLAESRTIAKSEEKQTYLEKAVEQNTGFYRLQAELGSVYFLNANYTRAVAAFDASLDFLPQEYTQLYGTQRDEAAKLYEVESDLKKDTSRIIALDTIALSDMTALAQDASHALDFITGTERRPVKTLAEQLKHAGWYASDASVGTGRAKRKDAALFLWHIIAAGDTALLNRYSTKYMQRGGKSPLPDVSIDGVYFDSILGTVEEDIIPLVDGKRFNPEGAVSGLDFYTWLKKADSLRR